MEKEYTISWLERKEYNGTPFIVATFGDGLDVTEFTIWKKDKAGLEFPNFDNLAPGSKVSGNMWTNPKTGKLILYPPKAPKQATGGGYKQKLMDEAMAKKEASIGKFQATKEESIRLSSAQRDSVLLVTTFYKDKWANDPILESEMEALIKRKIIELRDWLLLSREFNDVPPFE